MRRGCLVLALLVLGLVGTTGCKPLYSGKPEKQVNPKKTKKPVEEEVATASQPKYIEDCPVSFREDPKTFPKADLRASAQAAADGDAAVIQGTKATDKQSKGALFKAAIEKYRTALQKSPYDANITLKLAVSYDTMLRKGCALALLRRIADLRKHPKFMREANNAGNDVAANGSWFAGYRKDANAAVGN
jgi:hypothetical protein